MRHTLLDRIARLLILGALSTGVAGSLSAAPTILTGPDDVKANAVMETADGIDYWKLNGGTFSAADTARVGNLPYMNVLDGGLAFSYGTALQVRGTGPFSAGLAVRDGMQMGFGSVLSAGAVDGGRGLFAQNGDFISYYGTIITTAEGYDHDKKVCSAGILVAGEDGTGHFVQTGGSIDATGKNGGDGIVLKNGNYTIQSGELNLVGSGKTFEADPTGIRIPGFSGAVVVIGNGTDYYGCGLVLDNGDFIQNGGTVNATGQGGGAGLVISDGNFVQNGGSFALRAGDGGGLASATVHGDAEFGANAVFNVFVDGVIGEIGTMYVSGDTIIKDGATLDVGVVNSVLFAKDAPITGVFLEAKKTYDDPFKPAATGTIQGEFTTIGADTLTLHYEIAKSAGDKEYVLTTTRKAYASEVLDDNNARLAESLETWLPKLDVTKYAALNEVYTRMDVEETQAGMDAIARGLTAWQATQFARISLSQVDATQTDMSRNLDIVRRGAACNPCEPCDPCEPTDDGCGGKRDLRHVWFAGHGNFAHYGAKTGSFSALDVDSYGMMAGLARKLPGLGQNTVAGVVFNYTSGQIDGSAADSEYDYYGLLGTLKTDLRRFGGWAEFSVGYSRADFDQLRYDFLGYRHYSNVDQDVVRLGANFGKDFVRRNNFRFTPVAGLEYTMIRQSGHSEHGNNSVFDLNVSGDTMNSLRLRFGLEGAVKRRDLTLTAHGALRYEMLDRCPILGTSFAAAPMIRFQSRGQDVDRCSGVTGLRLGWRLNESSDISASYDFTVGDKYTEHWINVGLRSGW